MKKALIMLLLFVGAGELYAQVPPPPAAPPPSANVPLDPFSWVVLGAAGTAAAGKYYRSKKNIKE